MQVSQPHAFDELETRDFGGTLDAEKTRDELAGPPPVASSIRGDAAATDEAKLPHESGTI